MGSMKDAKTKSEHPKDQKEAPSKTRRPHQFPVTFNVTIPDDPAIQNTPVFLSGCFKTFSPNLPDWDPRGLEMKNLGHHLWSITLMGHQRAEIEYKYTRGGWNQVETDEQGNDIPNRRTVLNPEALEVHTIQDTVKGWRKS